MTREDWEKLQDRDIFFGHRGYWLGHLLGYGGAGAVYELFDAIDGSAPRCIKLLDSSSPVGQQELASVRLFRARARFSPGLIKFFNFQNKLKIGGKEFDCYIMPRGEASLEEAIQNNAPWLQEPDAVKNMLSGVLDGLYAMTKMGFAHGDIKPGNILFVSWGGKKYTMLSDYGTVSEKQHGIHTISYEPAPNEYGDELEKQIAYDLHCLYLSICWIYHAENDDLDSVPGTISRLLRVMRDSSRKAYTRLLLLKQSLPDARGIPVDFFLNAVPRYDRPEDLPFEHIMEWQGGFVLRNQNDADERSFDPMFLQKISPGTYEAVRALICQIDDMKKVIMPICRYFEQGNEYVLIHAPDDWTKCAVDVDDLFYKQRIQDADAIPYTLECPECVQEFVRFGRILKDHNVDSALVKLLAPQDVWHMEGTFKINLFSVYERMLRHSVMLPFCQGQHYVKG